MTAEAVKAGAIAGPALAAALLLACATAGTSGASQTAMEHPFETVLAEVHSGLPERRREVIRDETSWVRLWAEVHAAVVPAPPLPPVDFGRHMLIAVASGTRPSGGFAIKVRSVATRGGALEITVAETCPAPGAMVSMGLSQPLEVVKAPRLTQAPKFQETRALSCR